MNSEDACIGSIPILYFTKLSARKISGITGTFHILQTKCLRFKILEGQGHTCVYLYMYVVYIVTSFKHFYYKCVSIAWQLSCGNLAWIETLFCTIVKFLNVCHDLGYMLP